MIQSPWEQPSYKRGAARKKASNPAATKRAEAQHVKNRPYEAFRKTVTPALKSAEKLLTKRTTRLMQATADGMLDRAQGRWGPEDAYFVKSARLYYVPLVRNLQAGFAATKRAAATMRARATKQRDYDQAVREFTRASWEIAENLHRAGDLMKWENRPLETAFLDAFHELTETLRPGRGLAANPRPDRWRQNPGGGLVPAEGMETPPPPKTPQDILCMRCGAKPGVMCRTRSKRVAAYWHGRRNDDWNLVTGRDLYGDLK